MSFGVLGLRLAGMRVHDPEVVTKSWPDFWAALEALQSPGRGAVRAADPS